MYSFKEKVEQVLYPPGYANLYCTKCLREESSAHLAIHDAYCISCDTPYIPSKERQVVNYFKVSKLKDGSLKYIPFKPPKNSLSFSKAYSIYGKGPKLPKKYATLNKLQVCRNTNLSSVKVMVSEVENPKDIGIHAERRDWIPFTRFDKSGVRDVLIFVALTRNNPLPEADGLINLTSRYLGKPQGVKVYEATWIKTGRTLFTSYSLQEGYIASYANLFYHSNESQERAIRGVLRKHKTRLEERRLRKSTKTSKVDVAKVLIKKGPVATILELIPEDMTLTYKESRMAGNCKSGTDEFIKRYGYKKRQKIPVAELISKDPYNSNLWTAILWKLRSYGETQHEIKENNKRAAELLPILAKVGAR